MNILSIIYLTLINILHSPENKKQGGNPRVFRKLRNDRGNLVNLVGTVSTVVVDPEWGHGVVKTEITRASTSPISPLFEIYLKPIRRAIVPCRQAVVRTQNGALFCSLYFFQLYSAHFIDNFDVHLNEYSVCFTLFYLTVSCSRYSQYIVTYLHY